MPGLRPIVEGIDTLVMLNESVLASALFNASDPDGDPIVQYVFSDSGNPSSGFFVFQGIVQANGITLTIDAEDLDELSYVGGPVVGSEEISIQASDGTLLSNAAVATLFTARPESVQPITSVSNFTVLGNETVLASSFISAFDPDGFPITGYTIRDVNDDRSFFSLDGEAIAQGDFRSYTVDEFERLVYNGIGRRTEEIEAFAFDGSVSSDRASGVATVRANLNRPVVDFASGLTQQDMLTPISDFISFSDSDGNTIKTVDIRDRNSRFFSGSLVFQGEDLAPRQFHTFTLDELEGVFFRGGERSITEQLRYRVTDGRFRSSITTIELENVAFSGGGSGGEGSAGVPVLEADNLDNNVQEQLFFQNVNDLVTQVDNGFPGVTFEVIDSNPDPISAALSLDGTQLPGGEVLEFTDDQFEALEVRTGTFEGRFFDEIYFRTNNGSFNSDYERLNVHTEPEYFEAFTELDINGNETPTWADFISAGDDDVFQITYSFTQQLPNYAIGEVDENPNRMPTPRLFFGLTDAQRAAMRQALELFEQVANVEFVEVVDSPLVVDPVSGNRGGTLRFGNYYRALTLPLGGAPNTDNGIACTTVFAPGTPPSSGDIYFNVDGSIAPFFFTNPQGVPAISPCSGLDFINPTDPAVIGPGSFEFRTVLDALAFALGEGDPFDIVGPADQNPILPGETSLDRFTVQGVDSELSFETGLFTPITGLGLYDVNYFQEIYGVNTSFRTGDDLYSLPTFSAGAFTRETIWDAGGIDTLSAAGSSLITATVTVDLRPGMFSSIGGELEENIVIAFGAEIENAIGSDGDDLLIGNELGNEIIGGLGNDTIRGNGGDDLLTGGIGGDTFQFTIADGDNIINEMQMAGRDRIELIELAQLDSFEEDLTFRLDGRDLVIQLTLDGDVNVDTSITIQDQTRGSFRIETLNIGNETVDLVNLASQATGANQSFSISDETSVFGSLVVPT